MTRWLWHIAILLLLIGIGVYLAPYREHPGSWMSVAQSKRFAFVSVSPLSVADDLSSPFWDPEQILEVRENFTQSGFYELTDPPRLLWRSDYVDSAHSAWVDPDGVYLALVYGDFSSKSRTPTIAFYRNGFEFANWSGADHGINGLAYVNFDFETLRYYAKTDSGEEIVFDLRTGLALSPKKP